MPKLKALEQLTAWKERYPAPCQAACPVHTDVRSYVTLTAQGDFSDAYLAARGPNPLASICGRACSAPCEDVCTRGEMDKPIRIRELKRFLSDRYESRVAPVEPAPATGLSVAIVGAGPAGLAAAHDLALAGHAVTIYEASPESGGMAMLGVPRFRLSAEAIQRDVDAIAALGVVIQRGVRVGTDVTLEALRDRHNALFVAAGAMRPNVPDLPGRELEGVVQALDFLREANLGGRPACGERVAVIGGGYTAMDAARTAVRLGARDVRVFYRRTRSESEVHDAELDETVREGVKIEYLVSPLKVVGDGRGGVAGMEFMRNRLGEPDSSGRPRPVAIPGSEFVAPVDMVVLAIGQAADPEDVDAKLAPVLPKVDRDNLMTEVPGVFAGGDFVTGPSTIIEAVAHGQAAAAAIHRYLGATFAHDADWQPLPASHMTLTEKVPASERGLNGHNVLALDREVEQTLTRREAMAEGLRCLYCGLVPEVTFDLCTACQACALVCPVDCIIPLALDEDGNTRPTESFRDVVVYKITSDQCIKCGRCFGVCPTGAIVVEGFTWEH
ncbi:MAG: FAD-dependent oxidoreductase [Dehalococcoidia bacterium]|nr:FAD-dependent oxidoreductase [Dehalococcoidia bacterium]